MDVEARIAEHLARLSDGPFGDMALASGRALQPFSAAGQRRAETLLEKAARALEVGEEERAGAYLDRVIALPFDRHEECHPAALVAPTWLLSLIGDEVEASSDDDVRWLDAAIETLSVVDDHGRCEVRDALVAVSQDIDLTPSELRALRAAVADVPARPELPDLAPEPEQLRAIVWSTLIAGHRYLLELDSLEH